MKNKYLKNFKYEIQYLFGDEHGEVHYVYVTLAKTLFKAFLKIRKLKKKGYKFLKMEVIDDEE